MKKIAVMIAPGYEEGEALTIIDVLRRANFQCDAVGLTEEYVTGGHDITIKCDKVLDDSILNYDMIVLPGGYEGAVNLKENDDLIDILQKANDKQLKVAAMCAAPIVLDRAGLLKGKQYTAYVGYGDKISSGEYKENIVVVDGNLITSRGPATVYAFSYVLIDELGGDSLAVKNRMIYTNSFDDTKEDVLYV